MGLAVNPDHPAKNPLVAFMWGSDIHLKCVAAFLDHGALIHVTSTAEDVVLFSAISSTCQPELIELLCNSGAAVDVMTYEGFTPLQYALIGRAPDAVVSTLLHHGANPNGMFDQSSIVEYSSWYPDKPLYMAIDTWASDAVVVALVAHGANPDLKSKIRITAREFAEKRGRGGLLHMPTAADTTSVALVPAPAAHSWLRRVSELSIPVLQRYRRAS